jgi:hypothetical protein
MDLGHLEAYARSTTRTAWDHLPGSSGIVVAYRSLRPRRETGGHVRTVIEHAAGRMTSMPIGTYAIVTANLPMSN